MNRLMVLFIVLLLLKVFHVVDWSWWLITMPLWIGIAVYLALMFGAIALAFIAQ